MSTCTDTYTRISLTIMDTSLSSVSSKLDVSPTSTVSNSSFKVLSEDTFFIPPSSCSPRTLSSSSGVGVLSSMISEQDKCAHNYSLLERQDKATRKEADMSNLSSPDVSFANIPCCRGLRISLRGIGF